MEATSREWRTIGGATASWFEAPSLVEAAALAGDVVELSPDALVDVRPTGVRVRLDGVGGSVEAASAAVSAAARELGLTADPAALQQVSVVIESPDPAPVAAFWRRALDYAPAPDGCLTDPLRRDPALRVRRSVEPRPLRNRIHLDVVRPAAVVEYADLGDASGPYGVCRTDPDGNEVDLVPGDALVGGAGTADWQAVFSAVACYRTSSAAQQRDLVEAAAALADAAGFPLLIDLRPDLVILDSAKDLWDADAHGLDVDFAALAADVQAAARDLGATADPALPRFVQLFFDAADVPAVRRYWATALGYDEDPRPGLTDIVDARRLNPVLVFQGIDLSETERRRQRNRIHVELAVTADVSATRLAAILGAGGQPVGEAPRSWRIADPEGNELVLTSGA